MSLDPKARGLLRAGAAKHEPTKEDEERVYRALSAKIAAAGAVGAAAAAAKSASAATAAKAAGGGAVGGAGAAVAGKTAVGVSVGLGTKIVATVAIVSAASVGAYEYETSRGPEPTAPTHVEARSTATPPAAAPSLATANPASAAPDEEPAPSASTAEPAPEPPRAATARPSTSVVLTPAVRPAETAELAPTSPAPAAPEATTLPPAQPPAAAPPAPAAPPSPFAEEITLLQASEAMLKRGDAAGALAKLDEHARRFPNGTLAEERAASRVSALCALGRSDEARTAARAFLASRPNSPHAPRVRASCGGQ